MDKNTSYNSHIHSDKYVMLLVTLGMLCWNLSFYFLENTVAEILLAVLAMLLGVRVWLLFSRKFTYPIDNYPDRYVETAVIMIFFVTGLIQTFDGHFNDWFRVTVYAVAGLVIGMNIKSAIRH